jgi:hypothetical protein
VKKPDPVIWEPKITTDIPSNEDIMKTQTETFQKFNDAMNQKLNANTDPFSEFTSLPQV